MCIRLWSMARETTQLTQVQYSLKRAARTRGFARNSAHDIH